MITTGLSLYDAVTSMMSGICTTIRDETTASSYTASKAVPISGVKHTFTLVSAIITQSMSVSTWVKNDGTEVLVSTPSDTSGYTAALITVNIPVFATLLHREQVFITPHDNFFKKYGYDNDNIDYRLFVEWDE